MHGNGVVAISQDISNLGLNDSPENVPGFTFDETPPPAPELKSKGVVAMDITESFDTAAQKLDVGQLVKDPYFTLFESVGALEIMDPKMDSGYLEPGETMEDEYDFSKALLPEEIIGIIDQLLCHEMAWHMGHPLAQTIFTSLYIDRLLSPCPTSLEQTIFDRSESCSSDEPLTLRILRAYCIGLIKTCSFVNNRVKSEHYYEEEDFVTHTFNRSLLENIDDDLIHQLLNATLGLLSASDAIASDMKQGLITRLHFRSTLLSTVKTAESRTSIDIKALWMDSLNFIPDIVASTPLGVAVPSSFSVKLQRKLASTVPPRPIIQVSQAVAFAHLERLCRDGAAAIDVINYYDSHSLLTFVSLFQAQKPQPSVYVRTLLQHYLFGDMIILGSMSVRQVLDDDIAATVLPAHKLLDRANDEIELPSDPRFNMATRMEIFRSRAAGSYLDILRAICQNRCRVRRTLCHTIVDWDNLQLDSEDLDQELRQFTKEEPITDPEISNSPIYAFPLSSWAYFYKLRQMEWVVQIGFELETYQPDEIATMYWYLNYLAKTRARHLERIRGFVIRNYSVARHDAKLTPEKKEEYANAISFINYSTMNATATYGFADALSLLFAVLSRLSLIKGPLRPYSDDRMRYEVRMKPFASIGLPELIPFDELGRLVSQPSEDILDLLNFASESVVAARKGFEIISRLKEKDAYCRGSHDSWSKDIKNCVKACISTSITIAAVKKAVEAAEMDSKVKIRAEIPTSGKGYHDWWIVPKILPVS